MMKHPPLKRHDSLQMFSRDHYGGLVAAQHLLRARSADERRKALGEFLEAWRSEIAEHFVDEERLLTPLMDVAQRARMDEEHATLRALAQQAEQQANAADPWADFVRDLGQRLNDHIRWEERELFPALEQSATSEQLRQIGEQTHRIEPTRPRSQCASDRIGR
jgi:hemerythrin-like domain-containing protein